MKSVIKKSLSLNPFPKERDLKRLLLRRVSRRGLCAALVFVFSVMVSFSYAQPVSELYKNANQSYKANQFEKAIEDYEKIISQGYKNAEVYYNLGNCYYKTNAVSKSILNYERALKLSPDDEDIQHNIKLAYFKCSDKIQPVPQLAIITCWNNFVTSNNANGWGIYAMITLWISIVVFAISFFIGRRRIFNAVALLFLLISFTSLFLAIKQKSKEQNADAAILTAVSSYVKSAPDSNASDLFMIHEGSKLKILDQVGSWNKIRLEDGKVGWIEKGSFEKI